ncbi:MAG: hypothetical protein ACLKAK_04965 [Alkaliphilus sp.]
MAIKKLFSKVGIEKIKDTAFLLEQNLDYALLYYFDKVVLRKTIGMGRDFSKLIEAKIFGQDKMLHIFKRDEFEAVLFDDNTFDERFIIEEENYLIKNENFMEAKKICIKKYIDFDEDGQAFIAYTRPYKLIC